jgi:hypothetical protein
VQLTELLYQKVKDLAGQGQLSLKPGYVAVVSKSPSLRPAVVATLFPGPDDHKRLMIDSASPTRIGVGFLSADKTAYRLLRELGADRQLLKFDPARKSFGLLTDNALEIEAFLRVQCGLPSPDHYTSFFVVDSAELPSVRQRGSGAMEEMVDQVKVKQLKDELEMTRKYEGLQDRLYKVQQRLLELAAAEKQLADAQKLFDDAKAELARMPWTAEQMDQLTERALHAKDDQVKRDTALAELAQKKQHSIRHTPPPADPFLTNPWFYGGMAAGVLLDGVAFFTRHPAVALLALLPFTAALVAVLRFIEADEADKQAAQFGKELKEREETIQRRFKEEQAQLKSAMRAANVDTPRALLEVFKEREKHVGKHDTAKAGLDRVRKNPLLERLPVEMPLLKSEKAALEQQVIVQGFARPIGEIETDLKDALGLGAFKRGGMLVPEQDLPKHLVNQAAELLNLSADSLWEEIGPRLTQFLTALTDRRVVGGKSDGASGMILSAPDGKTGPFHKLPFPLKDFAYASLRLTLIERVVGYKRLPLLVDDAFASFDAPKRALISKMLKAISTQTQVLHRVAEPPTDGTADLIVQA